MSSPNENSALKSFIQTLCDVSELEKYPFSELYPWYFYEFTSNLKEEIINNLTSLNEKQFHVYLEYVKDKITEAYVYDPDECIIDRWLKEYELDEKDFPFYSNEKICKLLSSFNDVSLSKDEASKVRSIQLQFHWYSVYLEKTPFQKNLKIQTLTLEYLKMLTRFLYSKIYLRNLATLRKT